MMHCWLLVGEQYHAFPVVVGIGSSKAQVTSLCGDHIAQATFASFGKDAAPEKSCKACLERAK